MKDKVLFLRKFSPTDTSYLKRNLSPLYDLMIPAEYSDAELIKYAGKADIFLGNRVSRELLNAAQRLKLIQVPGVGIDELDLNLLKGRKIKVCNSRSSVPYVAEYAVALLMALIKKIPAHDRAMREGVWFKPTNNKNDIPYLADTLFNKTIGFLGFGCIAREIASHLLGFKPRLAAFVKKSRKEEFFRARRVRFLNLDKVLSTADIIFVTLPLTENTRGIISNEEFKLMKNTAYLINVSRAAVINQRALYETLRQGRIAGAALDVWYSDMYKEGDIRYPSSTFPFHKLDNIVLSPYRAGYVMMESPHLWDVLKNLTLFAKGGKLISIVDITKGY